MKALIYLGLFLALLGETYSLSAQSETIDSLQINHLDSLGKAAKSAFRSGKLEEASKLAELAFSFVQEKKVTQEQRLKTRSLVSGIRIGLGDFKGMDTFTINTFEDAKAEFPPSSETVLISLEKVYINLLYQGKYKEAVPYMEDYLERVQESDLSPDYTMNILINLSSLYSALNKFEKAKISFINTKNFYEKSGMDVPYFEGAIYVNLVDLHRYFEEYEICLTLIDEYLNKVKEPKNDPQNYQQLLFNKGIALNGLKRYREAKEQILLATQVQKEFGLDDQIRDIILKYNNLSIICLNLNEIEESKSYNQKAVDFLNEYENLEISQNIILNNQRSKIFEKEGDFSQAQAFINKSLAIYNYSSADKMDYRSLDEPDIFVETLNKKIACFDAEYQVTRKKKILDSISIWVDNLDHYLVNGLDQQSDKFMGNQVFSKIKNSSHIGLKALIAQGKLEKAWNSAENYRNHNLNDRLTEIVLESKNNEVRKMLKDESAILENYKQIKQTINHLSSADSVVLVQQEIELVLDSLGKIERYKKELKKQYTADLDQVNYDLESIASTLEPNEALMQFSCGDSSCVALVLCQNQEVFNHTFSLKSNQENDINKLIQGELKANKNLSNLFAPCYEFLDSQSIDNLRIIADGYFVNLPFEALSYNDRYWIEKFNISYGGSLKSLLLQNKKQRNNGDVFVFSPDYNGSEDTKDSLTNPVYAQLVRSGNLHLPGAKEESSFVSKLYSAKHFDGNEANKDNFLQAGKRAKIVHLAMHGIMNKDNPLHSYLLFDDNKEGEENKLYAEDIYTLNLNTDMMVLSACNTGTGKVSKNNGALSLSRALSFSGVPTTISSLWKVPDNATSFIMKDFYTNLYEGDPVDLSLQKAKLKYLESDAIPSSQKTPYYWSGFIANGNMTALKNQNNRWMYYILIIMILSLILFNTVQYFSKKQNNPR